MKILLAFSLLSLSMAFVPPPGGKAIEDGKWLDKTPVIIETYDRYLFETKGSNDQAKMPDSAIWYSHYSFSIGIDADFKTPNKKQRRMPMIGLTEKQIASFFTWRSKLVSTSSGYSIEYRLPTQGEIQKAEQDESPSRKYSSKHLQPLPKNPKHFINITNGPNELLDNGEMKKGTVLDATSFRGIAIINTEE